MAYVPIESVRGLQDFTNVDTSANRVIPVGTIVRGSDATLGGGEFIYLAGVASNIVGALVRYMTSPPLTTLLTNTAVQACPVAVSMSANTTTTSYSWYQISGVAVIKKTAVAFAAGPLKVYISATAGRIKGIVSAGLQLVGAVTANAATVASATSTLNVLISRPLTQSQIT